MMLLYVSKVIDNSNNKLKTQKPYKPYVTDYIYIIIVSES